MNKPKWLYEKELEHTLAQKWLSMDWKQWLQWGCSIFTFVLCMATIILPIVFVAMICVEGWDDGPFDGFICRIFTPYEY